MVEYLKEGGLIPIGYLSVFFQIIFIGCYIGQSTGESTWLPILLGPAWGVVLMYLSRRLGYSGKLETRIAVPAILLVVLGLLGLLAVGLLSGYAKGFAH